MKAPADRSNAPSERRQYRRVRANLPGRYMLTNGSEYGCRARDISAGGVALMAPSSGRLGERVIAYIDHIGRVEGVIVRTFSLGFAMIIGATQRGHNILAAKISRLPDPELLPEIIR